MTVLGVILRTRPADVAAVTARLEGLPGTDLVLDPGDGRMVVVIEDVEPRAEEARQGAGTVPAEQTLERIRAWPEVLGCTFVLDDVHPLPGLPGLPGSPAVPGLPRPARPA